MSSTRLPGWLFVFAASGIAIACADAGGGSANAIGGPDGAAGSNGPNGGATSSSPTPGLGGLRVNVGGNNSDDPTEMDNCGLVPYMLDPNPAPVLLVQDRSTSMRGSAEGATGTRWENLSTAVQQVVTQTGGSVYWGLKFFPNETTCKVSMGADIAPLLNNAAPIVAALRKIPGDSSGSGLTDGTPTRAVLNDATTYLSGLPGERYIVLVTDGQPTCKGDGPTADDTAAALDAGRAAVAAGIKIVVVGIGFGVVEAGETLNPKQQFLNDMADIGGMARNDPLDPQTHYYSASNTNELLVAFSTIASQVVSCTFTLPKVPPVPSNVAVRINDTKIARERQNGWDYDPGMSSLTLHGTSCSELLSSVGATDVKIIMGCPGQEVP